MIPSYLSDVNIWVHLYPLLVFSATISLIFAISVTPQNDDLYHTFIIVFSMALLGVVAGYVTGQSREPAVSAVIPAVLTLIGAVMVYVVAGKTKDHQLAASIITVAFVLNFLFGVSWGAHARDRLYEALNSQEMQMHRANVEQNLKLLNLQHLEQIQRVKESLGLKVPSSTD